MLIGVDYASVDRNQSPDFEAFKAACKAAGSTASVAIIRGAYGTLPDPTLRRDFARARSAGLTCGAYLFLRMDKAEASPEEQVYAFADNVGILRADDLVPVLDVEATGLSAEAELEWVHRAWLAIRRIYGAPPIIYDSARVWAEDLHNLPAGEMADSPQWVAKPWPFALNSPAHLASFAPGQYEPPMPPSWGAGNWWMHQYQGDARPVPGFTNTVDLSRFKVMREGERGARVRWAQARLGLQTTGTFEATMASRVRALQMSSGLVVDAVIGPKTFARLAWRNGVERPFSAA
jgi:GH25 family lysozyme M1 (1,4-beta-N-acetylmuramidase)